MQQLAAHFELKQSQVIEAPLQLDQQALKNLIAMTPYAYKANPERRSALEQNQNFAVSAIFQLYLFQKKQPSY